MHRFETAGRGYKYRFRLRRCRLCLPRVQRRLPDPLDGELLSWNRPAIGAVTVSQVSRAGSIAEDTRQERWGRLFCPHRTSGLVILHLVERFFYFLIIYSLLRKAPATPMSALYYVALVQAVQTAPFAGYILFDVFRRQPDHQGLWLFGAIGGWVALPWWLAFRPLNRNEKRVGGAGYIVLKYYAILFLFWGIVTAAYTVVINLPDGAGDAVAAGRFGKLLGAGSVGLFSLCQGLVPPALFYAFAVAVKKDTAEEG